MIYRKVDFHNHNNARKMNRKNEKKANKINVELTCRRNRRNTFLFLKGTCIYCIYQQIRCQINEFSWNERKKSAAGFPCSFRIFIGYIYGILCAKSLLDCFQFTCTARFNTQNSVQVSFCTCFLREKMKIFFEKESILIHSVSLFPVFSQLAHLTRPCMHVYGKCMSRIKCINVAIKLWTVAKEEKLRYFLHYGHEMLRAFFFNVNNISPCNRTIWWVFQLCKRRNNKQRMRQRQKAKRKK